MSVLLVFFILVGFRVIDGDIDNSLCFGDFKFFLGVLVEGGDVKDGRM